MTSKCVRCGLCCAHFPHCGHGNEDGKHGMCSFLVIGKKKTSCKLMLEGKIKPDGLGCVLRHTRFHQVETQKYFEEIHQMWREEGVLP